MPTLVTVMCTTMYSPTAVFSSGASDMATVGLTSMPWTVNDRGPSVASPVTAGGGEAVGVLDGSLEGLLVADGVSDDWVVVSPGEAICTSGSSLMMNP